MRLSVASSAAAEKLVNERSTPAKTSEVTLNSKWSVWKKEVNTSAAASLMTAWALRQDGPGVVLPTSGSHFGSVASSGLPSGTDPPHRDPRTPEIVAILIIVGCHHP